MFAFIRRVAPRTTSRKARLRRNSMNTRPGLEALEGRVVLDAAGSSIGTALNIGALAGRTVHSDSIGFFDFSTLSTDTLDFYKISLTNPGSLNVVLNGLSADADLQVLNSAGTVIGSSANSGTTADTVNLTSLAAGTYFVRVNQFSGDTNYNLTLTSDYAGDSTGAARNLGNLLGRQSVSDFVGGIDRNDFYRINLIAPGSLNVVLNGLAVDADLQVLNGSGTVIGTSNNIGTTPETINLTSLAAGTYFVRVNQFIGDTNYNLTLTADNAGNSTAAARNLGAFSGVQFISDFVGAIDTNDFYRITLTSPHALHVGLSGLAADADLQVLNGNGAVIGSSANGGTANETINFNSLAAGTYFVRVNQFIGDTNYFLTLTT
jgi:trimeric autotransporter adhesin